MYEDIEVMRRLLNRDFVNRVTGQCKSCHANPFTLSSAAFTPDGNYLALGRQDSWFRLWDVASGKQLSAPHDLAHPFAGAEGTYLKGVGVIYTITLPPLPKDPHAPLRESQAKPVSDWERVRKQLHGEKVPQPAAVPPVQPTLTQVLLKTLADNGRHFTQLGPKESLTIVVTFRGDGTSATSTTLADFIGATAKSPAVSSGPAGVADALAKALSPGQPVFPGSGKPDSATGAALSALLAVRDNPSSVQDYELMADLLVKQGRIDVAIKAYRTALELKPTADQHVRLYRKLAQAYLLRQQDAQARDAIEKGLQYLNQKKAQKQPATSATTTNIGAALPTQLIISASKELLERVGAGKISFDEFRRQAHVEQRTFPGVETNATGATQK
jgi:hypothetical protein